MKLNGLEMRSSDGVKKLDIGFRFGIKSCSVYAEA